MHHLFYCHNHFLLFFSVTYMGWADQRCYYIFLLQVPIHFCQKLTMAIDFIIELWLWIGMDYNNTYKCHCVQKPITQDAETNSLYL